MIQFICKKCGKTLDLENRIYEKAYKNHELCLSCRPAMGRPPLGVTKKVSITLPEEVWKEIEEEKGEAAMSAFLRQTILDRKGNR